jgi:exonuclease SbcC
MRLNYLELQNYRRFRSVELELPEGMVSIMGPNGAGKSSLMEAVAWCLYGNETEIVRTGKESIKRGGSAHTDPCLVRVEFEFEGTGYVVERSMKGKNLSMNASLHAGDKLMARGSDDVTEAVKTLFGMDHKSFFISVFARQKELNALTSYPKHQRKKLVLRMLEIENIEEAIRRVREDLRHLLAVIDNNIEELENEDGRSVIAEIKKDISGLEKDDKDLAKTEAKAEKELDKVERVQKKLKDEMKKLEEARDKWQRGLRQKDSLKATLKGQNDRTAELKKELSGLEKLEERVRSIAVKMKKNQKELDSVLDKRRTALKERDSLNSNMGTIKAAQSQIKTDISEIEGNVMQINDLGPESECPTCFRELGDTFEKLLESFDKQLIGKEKALVKNGEDIEKAKAALRELEARLKALDKRENILREKLKDWELDATKVERTAEVRQRLKETETKLKKTTVELEKVEKTLSSTDFNDRSYTKAKKGHDDVSVQLRVAEKKLQSITSDRRVLDQQLKASTKELARLEKLGAQIAEKRKEVELLSHLEKVMDDFKKHLISRIRPALARISSELLASLTNRKYDEIELSEDYDISIRDGGSFYRIDRFSGGESDLANLCLRLAISEVISEKHGSAGFGFIVLDEVFGSQDDDRKRMLLSTLNGLSNRFKQIFLITHVEDVKELMGNVIRVSEKADGTSTVEVV